MKKAIIVAVSASMLASCSLVDTFNRVVNTASAPSSESVASGSVSSVSNWVVKSGDTIAVDYVGRLEDGTIFDSSIEEFSKKSTNYSSGRTFEPLKFTVGAGQMIKGFDAGVVGMKLGEKKTITIAPKDGYGEAMTEQEVPKKYFEDTITQEAPVDKFRDTVEQVVPKSALGDKASDIVVGKTIDAQGIKAKVTKIDGDNVTVEIDNVQNPFYGKKLAVGLVGKFEENTITIKKIVGDTVTLSIENRTNPFYGKKLAVGLKTTTKDGQELAITKITDENVTVSMPNTNKLAGKTLIFDVTIKNIEAGK